jgi:flagellar basal-body rod protein FlgB
MQWLSVRQAVVAQNVSNANTPGYTARDVPAFEDVMDDASMTMAATNSRHLGLDKLDISTVATKEAGVWETTYSGNTVSVEQEMMKAGDVNRAFSLNTSVLKAFDQMLMNSAKG